jgi:hypothetical protein
MSAESDDIDQLRDLLLSIGDGETSKIRLTIQAGPKRVHTTIFSVSNEEGYYNIKNNCIEVQEGSTQISANSPEKACFDPLLYSDPPGSDGQRITTTDVLQVLKTKIVLATLSKRAGIGLTDAATKNNVSISAYNLLQGKRPIYEKYGYFSSVRSADIISAISTTTWGQIKDKVLAKNPDYTVTFADAYGEMTGSQPDDADLVPSVMRRVTLEQEGNYNRALKEHIRPSRFTTIGFSHNLVSAILNLHNKQYNTFYKLNLQSPEWAFWSGLIKIIDGDKVIQEGGGRFTHGRSPRIRRNRSTRSHVRGRGGQRVTQKRVRTVRRAQ